MKFTYSWLKDYVDIKLKPQELAEKFTMAGLEIESVEQTDGEWVFQAEVTTNRPDWLSIIGIAREAAAITGSSLRAVYHKPVLPRNDALKADIQILDIQGCPRYTGRIISNVNVGPSPDWLKKRVQSIGLRPVNNIVDITNFVLFETGQPLHAFDLDKLKGKKIIVRRAKENEEIIAIDGSKKKLNQGVLVIADEKSPVAIAGIMGGKDTEVMAATKNILLESAYFDPVITRRASKALGLSSESSYRFERNVDYEGVKTASDRATALILQSAGGSAGKFVDIAKKKYSPVKVSVRTQRVNDLLGIEIPSKEIVKILNSLGLVLSDMNKTKLTFSIPSWRRDLNKEIDLIEEIIRIYGYDRIPVAQPRQIEISDRVFMPALFEFQGNVRDALIAFGLNEVLTYSLTDKDTDEMFQEQASKSAIRIGNPLGPRLAVLRTNLIAGILGAARWNLNRNINDVKLFEISSVYFSVYNAGAEEKNCLAICISGNRADNWQDSAKPADFYYLKGIVEGLFAKLGIENYQIAASDGRIFDIPQSAQILVNAKTAGFFGKVSPQLLAKMDIDKDCFVCQLSLDELLGHKKTEKKFSALPKFPAVYRDISMLTKQGTSCDRITALIKNTAGTLLVDIKLFDVYSGERIPKGHRSFAYRLTYQSPDKTLTDKEVDTVHSNILAALKENLDVQIR